MPKKKPRPKSPPVPEFLLPQPSAEGIRRLQASYLARKGKDISEADARDVLSRLMRWQYLNVLTNTEKPVRKGAESGEEEPDGLERDDETVTREPGAAEGDAGGEAGARGACGAAAARFFREPRQRKDPNPRCRRVPIFLSIKGAREGERDPRMIHTF